MAREPAARRDAILDAAQRLIYTRGYQQMTIQDLQDELAISKGAFYHYFGSKQELLEVLVNRMVGQVEQILAPIVDDPQLGALDKLGRYFESVARWKAERLELMLALLRVWYADDNALAREKVVTTGVRRITPFLQAIIRQGVAEGSLSSAHPDQVAQVVWSLLQGLGDALAALVLAGGPADEALVRIAASIAVYTDALERVLGAAPGTLHLVDLETMRPWVSGAQAVSI